MREYELMYISRPSLEDQQQQALQERVTGLITKGGGEITGLDVWGKRRLGYTIDHETDGYYILLTFKGEEALIRELDRILSITDDFMRFKTLRIDHIK